MLYDNMHGSLKVPVQRYIAVFRKPCIVKKVKPCSVNLYIRENLKIYKTPKAILRGQGVRVSGGHLCEAEAPTEPTGETQSSLKKQ